MDFLSKENLSGINNHATEMWSMIDFSRTKILTGGRRLVLHFLYRYVKMSSTYFAQEMLFKEGKLIRSSHTFRIICGDDYDHEPPKFVLYDSESDYKDAIEKEKTRNVGGTLYDGVCGYRLLCNSSGRFLM